MRCATLIDDLGHAFFGVIAVIMKAAPIGAFGAMAYTIGKYGPGALGNLGGLIATFYITSALFIVLVLGTIARMAGFFHLPLPRLHQRRAAAGARHLLVGERAAATDGEAGAPRLLEAGGRPCACGRRYTFNLDGTNIYLTLATLFIAQAVGVELTLHDQLVVLGVVMLTSKGASGVTGAGFVTLAATLAVVSPALVPGMAIVLGVDKFISKCRAVTNIIGNGVTATIIVSAWEGELDREALARGFSRRVDPSDVEAAVTTG